MDEGAAAAPSHFLTTDDVHTHESVDSNAPGTYLFMFVRQRAQGIRTDVGRLAIVVLLAVLFLTYSENVKVGYVIVLFGSALIVFESERRIFALLSICFPLLMFVFLATFRSILSPDITYESLVYETLKGVYYSLELPACIIFGAIVANRLRKLDDVYLAIAIGAIVYSMFYIYNYLSNPGSIDAGRAEFREAVGRGSVITIIAIAVSYIVVFNQGANSVTRIFYSGCAMLSLLALWLSDSRTYFAGLAVLIMYCVFNLPAKKYTALIILSIIGLELIISTPLFLSQEKLVDIYLVVPQTLKEVIPIERHTMAEINWYWRGYETYVTFSRLLSGGASDLIFGTGMHTVVQLPFSINLGTERSDIPVFHNGFYFVFFRCGIIGFLLFVWQHLKLVGAISRRAFIGNRDEWHLVQLACGLLVFGALSTAPLFGLMGGGLSCVIIGFAIGRLLQHPSHLDQYNSSNRRLGQPRANLFF